MTLRIEPAATGLRPRPVPTPARCGQLPNPPLPRGAGVDRWIVACLDDGENQDRTAGSSIYPAVQD